MFQHHWVRRLRVRAGMCSWCVRLVGPSSQVRNAVSSCCRVEVGRFGVVEAPQWVHRYRVLPAVVLPFFFSGPEHSTQMARLEAPH
jgi:hypothetical protein